MSRPHATVLMAAYNAADYIAAAVQSVLDQTYSDFELLIVDDASTDTTAQIVGSFADARIRLISLEENSGAAAARNYGMRVAKSDFVAILDADDIAYPTRLGRQVAYMEHHLECSLLGSAFDVIDESGQIDHMVAVPRGTAVIRWCLLTRCVIGNSTVMLRRDDALAAGGYREGVRNGEDYALWAAMAPFTAVAQLPNVLVAYRDNPSGLARTRTREHELESVQTSRSALSRAAGRHVSMDAALCLYGLPPLGTTRHKACREALGAYADALLRMIAADESIQGVEPQLLRLFRQRAERLCDISPGTMLAVVATSTRLAWQVSGVRGFDTEFAVSTLRSIALAGRAHLRTLRSSQPNRRRPR